MPAVWTDTDGSARKTMEARADELRKLSVDDQERVGRIQEQSRGLERESTGKDDEMVARRLRAQARDLLQETDHIRDSHSEGAALEEETLQSIYELTHLKPGPAEQALAYKMNPTFPNRNQPGKIQVIAVSISPRNEEDVLQHPEQATRKAWLDRVKPSIDYAAIAALLD